MPGMTDDEIEKLLAEPEVGVLCTVDAQQRPEGSPIWFEHAKGRIVILVHRDSRKARNVRSNPNVSLTVDTRSAPYRGVILRGTATVSGPDPALRRRLAHRYLGPQTGDHYLQSTAYLDQEDALITMSVASRYSWDYSKGF